MDIKIYTYKGEIEYLENECIKSILEILEKNYDPEDYSIEDFLPFGNIGNIIVIISDGDYIGYGMGEIHSGERTFWINAVLFFDDNIWLTIVEEIERYFYKYSGKIKRQNYYYYSYAIPRNIENSSYHEIVHEYDGDLYAKPLGKELDNETSMFDTVPDRNKIDWMLSMGIKFSDKLDRDKILECITLMEHIEKYNMVRILNNIHEDEVLYENVYRFFSMKYHGLDRLYTMEEIVYHNYLIEQFYLESNGIVSAYELNNKNKYLVRCAIKIEAKNYSKKKACQILRELLKINESTLLASPKTKEIIVGRIFDIIQKNIWLPFKYEIFRNVIIDKLEEFTRHYYNTGDVGVIDIVAENKWICLLR